MAIAEELLAGAPFGEVPARRIDTHAASVFLTRDRAWKIKRPVRFDYLDFSTPDRRRAALCAELTLNRDLAPELYREVHAITRQADGALGLDGDGDVVDWVLEMTRFADGALLSEVAACRPLDPAMLIGLVDRIVDFHARSPVSDAPPGADRLAAVIAGNARAMAQFPETLPGDRVAELDSRLRAAIRAHAPLLDARGHAGRIRRGHGDLHLANIAVIDGQAVLFDRIEFSTELATGDVLYDLAFLAMDCWQRGLRREANLVCNRYLDRSAADESGVPLLPLFMAVRASVRAHVAAARARQGGSTADADEAQRYLDAALACLVPVAARLVAVGGASGTGKSVFARAIADAIGRVPGARILRTDLLRKRAAGVPPETALPATAYTAAASAKTYAALAGIARQALAAGQSVIADATFLGERERRVIMAIADDAGCRFDGIWLWAPDAVRLARVGTRRADASDADGAVALAQAAPADAPPGWHRLDATGSLAGVVAAGAAVLQ